MELLVCETYLQSTHGVLLGPLKTMDESGRDQELLWLLITWVNYSPIFGY